jgi:hypothetical protein
VRSWGPGSILPPLPPREPHAVPAPASGGALTRLTGAVAGLAGLRIGVGVGPCADKPRVVLLNDVADRLGLNPAEVTRTVADAVSRNGDARGDSGGGAAAPTSTAAPR